MSDSTEVQQDSAAQSAPVDTKDPPADSQTLEEAPAVPADAQPVAEQPQEVPQKAVEPEPQTGGWASWFQRVRQSAEQAVAICKHDLLEMTTQIKEDTTEAVESRSLVPTPSPHNSLFSQPCSQLTATTRHTEIDTKAHMENVATAVDHVIGTVASTLAAVPQMLAGEHPSSSPPEHDTHPLKFVISSFVSSLPHPFSARLSPSPSGVFLQPVGGQAGGGARRERGERGRRADGRGLCAVAARL